MRKIATRVIGGADHRPGIGRLRVAGVQLELSMSRPATLCGMAGSPSPRGGIGRHNASTANRAPLAIREIPEIRLRSLLTA